MRRLTGDEVSHDDLSGAIKPVMEVQALVKRYLLGEVEVEAPVDPMMPSAMNRNQPP